MIYDWLFAYCRSFALRRASLILLTRAQRTPRCRRLQPARFLIIFDQSIRHAVGVLAKNTFAFQTVDVASSFVVAGLNSSERILAVHHVGLTINHRTTRSEEHTSELQSPMYLE